MASIGAHTVTLRNNNHQLNTTKLSYAWRRYTSPNTNYNGMLNRQIIVNTPNDAYGGEWWGLFSFKLLEVPRQRFRVWNWHDVEWCPGWGHESPIAFDVTQPNTALFPSGKPYLYISLSTGGHYDPNHLTNGVLDPQYVNTNKTPTNPQKPAYGYELDVGTRYDMTVQIKPLYPVGHWNIWMNGVLWIDDAWWQTRVAGVDSASSEGPKSLARPGYTGGSFNGTEAMGPWTGGYQSGNCGTAMLGGPTTFSLWFTADRWGRTYQQAVSDAVVPCDPSKHYEHSFGPCANNTNPNDPASSSTTVELFNTSLFVGPGDTGGGTNPPPTLPPADPDPPYVGEPGVGPDALPLLLDQSYFRQVTIPEDCYLGDIGVAVTGSDPQSTGTANLRFIVRKINGDIVASVTGSAFDIDIAADPVWLSISLDRVPVAAGDYLIGVQAGGTSGAASAYTDVSIAGGLWQAGDVFSDGAADEVTLSRSSGSLSAYLTYDPVITGSFPATPLLDDFAGADTGPPPGSLWGTPSGSTGLRRVSNKMKV